MQTRMKARSLRRGVAAVVATMSVLQLQLASGAPGDIFSLPAPTLGADPPKASDIKAGDASVSTQTGALQYSYAIQVPPGRNGMAPSLSLSYSSQAPTYGGIASGWTMSIPSITEDHTHGRLATRGNWVDVQHAEKGEDPGLDDTFVSSLAGGRPLVMVPKGTDVASDVYLTYRAQNDDSFARYERMNVTARFRWRVRTSDGKVMTFGEQARMLNCVPTDQNAPLTGIVDAFGNEVRYDYIVGVRDECLLSKITWGQNANANASDFASVAFTYKATRSCNGVYTNSQSDYRSGARIVTGASTLQTITVTAYPPASPNAPVHTRRIDLGYDPQSEQCNRPHAPVRLLTSIKETAWGTDSPQVTLPAVTFEYNPPGVTLMTPQGGGYQAAPWAIVDPASKLQNLGWGYRRGPDRWPTVESMFLDVDGDGLEDLVTNSNDEVSAMSNCEATWHRNRGLDPANPGQVRFEWNTGTIALPRLKWHGTSLSPGGSSTPHRDSPDFEGCALNGQATAYRNAYGLPNVCHHSPGAACVPGSDPWDQQTYCYPGGTLCPEDPGGPPPPGKDFQTYLAYRWLDMDGDGLTDLVAAVHGDIDSYDIERGNVDGFSGGEPTLSGIPGLNEWPSCPRDQDKCKDLEKCFDGRFAKTCDKNGCRLDWTQILHCVSQSVGSGCSRVLMKPASGPNGAPGVAVQRHPYERCEGLHPWLIYWNRGGGDFATTPTIKYQPVPLESSSGDSALGGGLGMRSENHAIVDFDGDGILDAVVRATKQLQASWTAPSAWQVWLGDGTGGFSPRRIPFPTRTMRCPSIVGDCPWGANAISGTGGTWGLNTLSMAGLLDVNGDGALDHWLALPDTRNANIAFNDGEQIKLNDYGSSDAMGDVTTLSNIPSYAVKPGNDTHITPTEPTYPLNPFVHIVTGKTTALNRVVDVDNDGRPDVVTFSSETAVPVVHFNIGEQFIAPGIVYGSGAPAGVNYDALRRETEATKNVTLHETEEWKLNSDLVDLDGDGIPEGVFFTEAVGFRRAMPLRAQPPRLLRAVHNGRGAHSTITYAQMHDEDTVVQSPRDKWPDGRPKASPRAQWVVKSIESRDDLAGTTGTTKYNYRNPRFGADPDGGGRYSFRGFEEVTTTKPSPAGDPSGARTVQRYAYDVDASGRLVETIVMPSASEGANDARSIDRTSWQMLPLFNGSIRTYEPSVSEHYVCTNGQNEAACLALPAARTATTTTWTTYPLGGAPELWAQSSTLSQASGEPDRRTLMTYYLKAGQDQFILRPYGTVDQELSGGMWTTYGSNLKTWSVQGAQETDEVWVNGNDAERAITRFETDTTTGNRTAVWKPVQWAANPDMTTNSNRTILKYDDRKLFAVYETNELRHALLYKYEYGTGTRLETRGPNVSPCATSNTTCPAGTETVQLERIRVDGLGRMIERYSTFAEPGANFMLYKVESNSYFDGVGSYINHENAITLDWQMNPRFAKDRTDLDGHGRPIRKTTFVAWSAPANAVTTYTYAADGTMRQVRLPDPRKNDTSTVAYTYAYDSLGRPTALRRADAASTGIDLAYDGLVQTSKEFVGTAGGKQAATRTTKNSLGELVRVEEQLDGGNWALTEYHYDAAGNINQIIDPEGVTTKLLHDWAGRRTRIERADRAWSYTYDANGNMKTETSPCTGIGCEALYTTSIAYDVLDRPKSKAIAPRNLSDDERAAFGAGTETFTWDEGFNAKGQLVRWQSFAPFATNPTNDVSRTWSLQGQRNSLRETFRGAGYGSLTRATQTTHTLSGAVDSVSYGDAIPGTSCPGAASYAEYDDRGLPYGTSINTCTDGSGSQAGVINARNVAGLVTRRSSTLPPTSVESNWSYDELGRVTSQVIKKGSPLTQVARQDVAYNGNDDPRTLDHWLGTTNHKRFTFEYDLRHQLTSVAEDANAFAATYAYSDAGRFKNAKETAAMLPGSEVKPRDVTYQYAGRDPEQVTALVSPSGPYAQYTYDDAGNQVTRTYPTTGESWLFTYDGKNQLRRAIKKQFGVTVASEDYFYDDANARQIIVKRDSFGAKSEMRWFIGDTEAHYTESGTIKRIYSYVSMGTPIARIERSSTGSSSVEYQFHGLANNTLAAVDQTTGTVNASFVYAPFGEVIEATEGTAAVGISAHRRRMNDKYVDEATGLSYYGFRFYDNLSMTWTQSDPLYRFAPDAAWTEPRKAALYTFSLNNSLRYFDPDGCAVGAGAVIWFGLRTGAQAGEGYGPAGMAVGAAVGVAVAAVVVAVGRNKLSQVVDDAEATGIDAGGTDYNVILGSRCPQCEADRRQQAADNQLAGETGRGFDARPSTEDLSTGGRSTASDDGGPMAKPQPINARGKVYKVDGTKTPSGKPYVGRTKQASPEKRGKRDGRDRTGAEIVDTYDPNDTAAGRVAEQNAMNAEGGVGNLDNKRNEVAPKDWEAKGVNPPQ